MGHQTADTREDLGDTPAEPEQTGAPAFPDASGMGLISTLPARRIGDLLL